MAEAEGSGGVRACASARRRSRPAARRLCDRPPSGALSGSGQQMPGRGGVQPGTAGGRRCKNASIWCWPSALKTEQVAYSSRPPGLEQRPQRVQQFGLHAGQRVHVVGTAQPAHVGVAAHDAAGGAGGVEQDGVEGPAVPPGAGLARVAGLQRRRAAGPGGSGVLHAGQAHRVAVQRQQVQLGQLQQVRGLAAGAAQASSTRAPRGSGGRPLPSSSGAARCAAASCTETSPSAKPCSACTGQGSASTTAWPPSAGVVEQRGAAAQRGQPLHVGWRRCRGGRSRAASSAGAGWR
jgi:hypothetical protein